MDALREKEPLIMYQRKRRLYQFAFHVAVNDGIFQCFRDEPVFEAGCGNPYIGFYRFLRHCAWKGDYIGADVTIPQEARDWWKEDIYLLTYPFDGSYQLPLPPVPELPLKKVAVAFCIDSLSGFRDQDATIAEMKRIAAMVVVIGGTTEGDLRTWDFRCGTRMSDSGLPLSYGIWMDLAAEKIRRRMDVYPATARGWFTNPKAKGGVDLSTLLYVCQFCGEVDPGRRERFKCRACGRDNRPDPITLRG